MVRELERSSGQKHINNDFPADALTAHPVFYRTYSRRTENGRETWTDVCDRTVAGLEKLGKLSKAEKDLIYKMQREIKSLTSGRWLWVGGTEWIENPANFSGAYNCSSTNITDWRAFGLLMDLAMMGCGTGAVLEPRYINQLPIIKNTINVTIAKEIGLVPAGDRQTETTTTINDQQVLMIVGDSRQGWVQSYQTLLELSTDQRFKGAVDLQVDLSHVRPAGEKLKGFGGVANPVKLTELYVRCSAILNKAIGRQLNSVECCLLIDEAAVTIVAGNIRRCIAYGERVSAISGMKPIQDINVGELVLTSSGEYKPVVNKFIQGVQDIVEIRTAETSIRCTAKHKIAVYNSLESYTWKYAGELQPGDRLISVPHRKGLPCSTADYAWLVGFFIGDGHADIASSKRRNGGGGSVIFAFSRERLNGALGQKCLRILKSLGYTPSISMQENQAYIKVYRKELADELIQYKQPWSTPIIPEFVWLGTEQIRAAFLAGLADADAGPSRNVLLNSNKIEFLRQVQKLALSLGISTTLHEREPKMLPGRDTIYEGCHWLKIRGIQSQVNAVAFINPYMGRIGFRICGQKKNGLSLPYQFIEEVMANGWRAKTVRTTKSIINPSHQGGSKRDANWDTLLSEGIVNPDWLPLKVQLVVPAGQAETFDIEVESDHEFICQGVLVSNSAGMRQGINDDHLFAGAKENLWQQDAEGNWRIDPERDALRMSNHTRVFHTKPDREESITAVRKQFYSGEGAIQWAGEAVARANSDLLNTPALKTEFLHAYAEGQGENWLKTKYPHLDAEELAHRFARIGLNPCHSGDTLVSCDQGLVPIKELVNKPFKTLVDLRSIGLSGVKLTEAIAFSTGVQTTYIVTLANGLEMRCTQEHEHYTNKGWVRTKDLTPEHSVYIQRGEGHFGKGSITVEQAQMLGWLYGDGAIYKNQDKLNASFYINPKEYATAFPLLSSAVESLTGYKHKPSLTKGIYVFHSGSPQIHSFLNKLGIESKDSLPNKFLSESREVVIGFLQGLFCADGCVSSKARHIELRNRSKELLRQVQLLLLNLGIKSSLKIKEEPGGKGVPYVLKDGTQKVSQNRGSWRILIYSGEGANNFYKLVGFPLTPEKQLRLEQLVNKPKTRIYSELVTGQRYTAKVVSVKEFGEEVVYDLHVPLTHSFIANGCITHNCGEIIGANFHCNLSEVHLNQLDPHNQKEQEEAFQAAALSVAVLLNHQFVEPRYHYSRQLDPIVGVSFTGLFDFFVNALGVEWLKWWEAGRPATVAGLEFKEQEAEYLNRWQSIVHQTVWDYCDRHGLKRPNRCTTVQPSGTKSLLTGASPGWHPPKAQRFIRRITFRKNDPVALACIDYGYSVIPSQSDKDENGHLLNDPYDPRCTEWLIEIPVAVNWADLPGADQIDISKFNAIAQFDFYMQVQKYYTRHNTSATIELRENEIEALGDRIYQAIRDDEGYISAALLARFDDHQAFPRLPFEPISRQEYDQMMQDVLKRRQTDHFHTALMRYDLGEMSEAGPAGCDSDKCLLPEQTPNT